MAVYTIEIEAHTGDGGVQTFYAASGPFNTSPGDLPANQHFHPSLQTPANFERALFSTGSTLGASSIGFGEIVLVNAHGRYDAWPDYAFDGRPCIVKAIQTDDQDGRPLWSYQDAPVLIRGTVESVDTSDAFRTIRVVLYDRLTDLDKPLLTQRYGGTTIAGGLGADGTADLTDTLKPVLYGTKFNLVPSTVNPFDLIYQVSARPCTNIVVYDGGVALDRIGDVGTLAELLSAQIQPGFYLTCDALGLFRLGGSPFYPVTVDAEALGFQDAAGIARQMLRDFGLADDEIDEASFAALAAANPAVCGYFITDGKTVLTAVTDVLRSVGGWIIPDGQGIFQVGRLEPPAGSPIALFQEWQIRGDLKRVTPGGDNRGIPAYRVVVRFGQIGKVQSDGEFAGGADATRRANLSVEWRNAVAEDLALKDVHLLAQEMTFDTCLLLQADAVAEAQRLLAIYRAQRTIWRVQVDMTDLDYRYDHSDGDPFTMAIGLGREVQLSASRFLTPPKNLIVIGRVEDCVNNRIQFDLWG